MEQIVPRVLSKYEDLETLLPSYYGATEKDAVDIEAIQEVRVRSDRANRVL